MSGVPYDLTQDRAPQLGLVVLQSDESIERDMRHLLSDEIELLVTRIPSGEDVSPETLAAMEGELAGAVALFPSAARFSAVGFGCTSGTAQIGANRIKKVIQAGCSSEAVTEPISALRAACKHLGVRRLGMVSPYAAAVSNRLNSVLGDGGLEITSFVSFNISEEARVVRIAPDSIVEAAIVVANRAACDAIFLSCTNLRVVEIIDEIEAATGLPVLSSNQVLAWDMLRLAGVPGSQDNSGKLWRV